MSEQIIVLSDKQKARDKINVWHGSSSNWINMVKELVGNSLDIFDNNKLNHIKIIIHNKNKIEFIDDATGIPLEGTASNGQPNYEAIFEIPFAGSKYSATDTVGCNGIFLFTLSATCEDIEYFIARPNNNVYNIAYHKGDRVKELNVIEKSDTTYSKLIFSLDEDVWDKPNFTYDEICNIVQGQSSLANVKISVEDKENNKTSEFYYANGILDYFNELTSKKNMITHNIRIIKEVETIVEKNNEKDKMHIDLLFNYSNDSEDDIQKDYLNTADLIQHGTIQDGIILGLKNSIHKWLKNNNKYNKNEKNISLEDVSTGLNYICNVKSFYAEYVSQVKQQTLTPHYKTALQKFIEEYMEVFFIENPIQTELICNQVLINSRARLSADKTRQNLKKKLSEKIDNINNRALGLTDCKYHGEGSELFIAEGKSAKGSIVLARDPKYQAVYPIRGKILNCLKASYDEIFKSPIITELIKTMGCGVSIKSKHNKELNTFNINNLRYERIIIGSDQDFDGFAIQALVLTMIYTLMRELIFEGKIYIAQTPLFVITNDKTDEKLYAFNDDEKDEIVKKLNNKCRINRLKGLGEASPEDMYNTALNPETRQMIRVTVDDVERMIEKFNMWMDDDVKERKDFIVKHLSEYINDEE